MIHKILFSGHSHTSRKQNILYYRLTTLFDRQTMMMMAVVKYLSFSNIKVDNIMSVPMANSIIYVYVIVQIDGRTCPKNVQVYLQPTVPITEYFTTSYRCTEAQFSPLWVSVSFTSVHATTCVWCHVISLHVGDWISHLFFVLSFLYQKISKYPCSVENRFSLPTVQYIQL
jgi:hypothetical protein